MLHSKSSEMLILLRTKSSKCFCTMSWLELSPLISCRMVKLSLHSMDKIYP
eukprot:CCRYP_009083-RC/>CCRYP_009083-RC protein AED:0.41 eAED:0.41 QI:0/-1/0/1/-1/0/1/0/50